MRATQKREVSGREHKHAGTGNDDVAPVADQDTVLVSVDGALSLEEIQALNNMTEAGIE